MRRIPVLLAIAVVAVLATACADPLATPSGPAPLRYRDNVFATVAKTSDVVYGTAVNQLGQSQALKLDVYQPVGDSVTSRPAIVWVHGGGFSGGDKGSAELVIEANQFALKGFVNVSIDYRLAPHGCSAGGATADCLVGIQQAMWDAQTAVRYLRENAATYGIDTNRIAIGGSSAGAITALNVGYNGENPGPGDHQGVSSSVRAAQSISGAALGTGPIGAGDAPALDFHCTTDPLVPYAWAQNTVDLAKSKGLVAILRSWNATCHVPFAEHAAQILDETRNFFYSQMDLAHAAK
jgi:acetyl esterase/lipase